MKIGAIEACGGTILLYIFAFQFGVAAKAACCKHHGPSAYPGFSRNNSRNSSGAVDENLIQAGSELQVSSRRREGGLQSTKCQHAAVPLTGMEAVPPRVLLFQEYAQGSEPLEGRFEVVNQRTLEAVIALRISSAHIFESIRFEIEAVGPARIAPDLAIFLEYQDLRARAHRLDACGHPGNTRTGDNHVIFAPRTHRLRYATEAVLVIIMSVTLFLPRRASRGDCPNF